MSHTDPNPNLRRLCNRPVCIICGRPAEAEAIAKALGILENRLQGHEIQKVNNGHTFYLGAFTLPSGGELDYYVTSSLRQGIQSFTINAAVLFSILRPRFAIHAGVCAGYDDDDPSGKSNLQLRDVVFGEAAINYEEGKFENVEGRGVFFRPDYNRVSSTTGDMQAFAESTNRPSYHYGEYITGSAVRGDASAVFQTIRSNVNRNAIALDMEASAFLQLCEHFGADTTKCLGVVKGISDFGNSDKGKDENAYGDALRNTASALREWIVHRIPAITWEVDESLEPGAKIVPGYYDNFVRRVLDNYCQGWPVTLKDDPKVIIPHAEIKGLKTVLPKDRQPSFVKELGPIRAVTERYGIKEVNIGGSQGGRYLYYKAGYLIDWSRCVNSLEEYEDKVYQVGVFERLLNKRQYYLTSDESAALASVVTWEDTIAWLKEIEKTKRETALITNASSTENPTSTRHTPTKKRNTGLDVAKRKKSLSQIVEWFFHPTAREQRVPPLPVQQKH